MNYIKITKHDIANGPGIRVVLWVSGCSHRCKGCHNPETWDINNGMLFDKDAKMKLFEYLADSTVQGITISGGDPLSNHNINDTYQLIDEISEKYPDKDIWVYTGFKFEELDMNKNIDVLVDGEFEIDNRNISLPYCGSTNQRVIDVKKTISTGYICLYQDSL